MSARATIASLLLLAPLTLHAQPAAPTPPTNAAQLSDDGYCDFVQGTASANAATRALPEVFGEFGYIEQPSFGMTPGAEPNNRRVLGGVRYTITNLLVASATKSVAAAECRRHRAQAQLQSRTNGVLGAAAARGLAAKLRVYEEAQTEAQRILTETQSDLEARRLTAPEAFATRMRVEDLRSLAAQTRIDMAAIPPQDMSKPVTQAATDFAEADADVERAQGRLRSLAAYDVQLRAGADRFLDGATPVTDYFAVVRVTLNLGAFMTGSGNRRSAAGRARYAQSQLLVAGDVGPNMDQVRAMIEVAAKRAEEIKVLVDDLGRQMTAVGQIPGEDSKRFRQTLWFDVVKSKAELASLQAHVAALREIGGAQ